MSHPGSPMAYNILHLVYSRYCYLYTHPWSVNRQSEEGVRANAQVHQHRRSTPIPRHGLPQTRAPAHSSQEPSTSGVGAPSEAGGARTFSPCCVQHTVYILVRVWWLPQASWGTDSGLCVEPLRAVRATCPHGLLEAPSGSACGV